MSTNNGDLYFFEKEYTNMDDIALVTNARQGESIALNCIFEKYNDYYYLSVYYLTKR